jgi:hypothetical protein
MFFMAFLPICRPGTCISLSLYFWAAFSIYGNAVVPFLAFIAATASRPFVPDPAPF